MAMRNQLRNVIRMLVVVALLFLASAIFMSSKSRNDFTIQNLRFAQGRKEIPHGQPLARCLTKRQEEVEQVIRNMETKERSSAFEKIFAEDYWGGGESRSGPGSRRDYTENVRKLIALALKTYGVQELLDAPCGDVNWQPLIPGFGSIKYTGFDIVPPLIDRNRVTFKDRPNMTFVRVDFTNTPVEDMVHPDLIVCRDAIQHNTLKDGLRGLINLENTGAKYIITNWHSPSRPNRNIKFGGYYPIDIFTPPFNFSHPEMFISEGVGGVNPGGKFAGLWKLPALLKGDGKPFMLPLSLITKARKGVVTRAELQEARLGVS
ncbi:hypothetical protein R1sor_009849 [Riccia sorocarpa]|uniref:Methyltransferase type 11 domain-containing protein n=1 Tax=Riccia sorocarpa TaxID=122646 RepID=A0ABD3HWE5_9MARC